MLVIHYIGSGFFFFHIFMKGHYWICAFWGAFPEFHVFVLGMYQENCTMDAEEPKALGVRGQGEQVPRHLRNQDLPQPTAGVKNRCICSVSGRYCAARKQKQRHLLDGVLKGRTYAQGSLVAQWVIETRVLPTLWLLAQGFGLSSSGISWCFSQGTTNFWLPCHQKQRWPFQVTVTHSDL